MRPIQVAVLAGGWLSGAVRAFGVALETWSPTYPTGVIAGNYEAPGGPLPTPGPTEDRLELAKRQYLGATCGYTSGDSGRCIDPRYRLYELPRKLAC